MKTTGPASFLILQPFLTVHRLIILSCGVIWTSARRNFTTRIPMIPTSAGSGSGTAQCRSNSGCILPNPTLPLAGHCFH